MSKKSYKIIKNCIINFYIVAVSVGLTLYFTESNLEKPPVRDITPSYYSAGVAFVTTPPYFGNSPDTFDEVLAATERFYISDPPIRENQETTPVQTTQKDYISAQSGRLTKSAGVFNGPSGKETWYNLGMSGVVNAMRALGYSEEEFPYHIREDGVKMLGDYVMIAANLNIRPKGTIVETSLGPGLVCDTGGFAKQNETQVDIAVDW